MFRFIGAIFLKISGSADKTVLVWDVRTSKPINAILAHSSEITSLDFSHDSTFIVSASTDGFWYYC
jgi:WD40 repeat protein